MTERGQPGAPVAPCPRMVSGIQSSEQDSRWAQAEQSGPATGQGFATSGRTRQSTEPHPVPGQPTPPTLSARSLRQSHNAKSHRQVAPPSHSAKSLRQVTPPSRSAKPLRQATLPRGEGGERPGEGLRGRWQRQGKTAVEPGGALPSKSDSPRSEPVGLVLPAQAEGLGFGPQIASAL